MYLAVMGVSLQTISSAVRLQMPERYRLSLKCSWGTRTPVRLRTPQALPQALGRDLLTLIVDLPVAASDKKSDWSTRGAITEAATTSCCYQTISYQMKDIDHFLKQNIWNYRIFGDHIAINDLQAKQLNCFHYF